jgi:hypothetical protein
MFGGGGSYSYPLRLFQIQYRQLAGFFSYANAMPLRQCHSRSELSRSAGSPSTTHFPIEYT